MDAWTAHSRCAKMAPRSDPPNQNLIITKSEWHQNQPLGLIFCLFLRSSDLNFLTLANSVRDISKIALKKTLDLFLTRHREILTRRREIFTRSNLFFSLAYSCLRERNSKILSLAVKNIEVNFILFRSLIRIFAKINCRFLPLRKGRKRFPIKRQYGKIYRIR